MKRLLDGEVSTDAERLLRFAATAAPPAAEDKQKRIIEAAQTAGLPMATSSVSRIFSHRRTWPVLAIVVGLTGSVAGALSSTTNVAIPTEPVMSPSSRAPGEQEPSPAALPAPEQGVRVDDLPSAPVVTSPSRVSPAATSPAAVRDELGEIDAARAALDQGRARDALARIDQWRKGFSSPRYAEEAEALEVQALAALGRRDEARAKGERFLASRPHSAYERRIRATLSQVQP
ncbi:hypothetical protein AKJ09_01628 [Labilithrix luteola]|uniref:Uncharacterized protein n=2 Tax=Labilithrix luteola TaxID=1391654 RepID=A0A0K1PPB4_9BACT|nr:hypothetical protein AKJ09_01628 [Labilithrix luteola]